MAELDAEALDLWQHQREAIAMCGRYFEGGPKRGALVQHPTGTGKTGVMAVMASQRALEQPVLIVCPSAALVAQLVREVRSGFWERIDAPIEWRPERVEQLLPSRVDDLMTRLDALGTSERLVVGTTVQALQQLHAVRARYARLVGRFGTVLFDEGHREPAPTWAQAVRGFGVPTVLFSATPFRNDIKLFDVDLEHVAFLSFVKAAEANLIREVDIDAEPLPDDIDEFARAVIAARDLAVQQGRFPRECKMIVRANDADDIRTLFDAFVRHLDRRTEGVLAVHDRFGLHGHPGAQLRPDVPADLRTRTERFLIHQFMLTEGIDDPSCTMLALYEPFSTERQLVQQIGRLTRHPNPGHRACRALVISRAPSEVRRMWQGFLNFDAVCVANGGKPPLRADRSVLEALVDALPEVDYIDGKFRRRLELGADLTEDLRLPRSALVFDVANDFDIEALHGAVLDALYEDDRTEVGAGSIDNGRCRFHLTIRLNQSRFLAESLFQSPSLEATIYSVHNRRLFLYDSAGLWPDHIKGIGGRAPPLSMRTLLPQGTNNTITQIFLKNTDLGPAAVRSRSQAARSLERAGVFVGENLNVVTRVGGRVGDKRRAIAFNTSRLRQGDGAEATVRDFHDWTRDVDAELSAAPASADLFARFALPVGVPADVTPVNILVDLDGFAGEFRGAAGQLAIFDLEDVCQDVAPNAAGPEDFKFRFELTVDAVATPVWMMWDGKKTKYWLRSEGLSRLKQIDNPRVSLTQRLNRSQSFRILPQGLGAIYALGRFYSVATDLSAPGGAGALVARLLTGVPELATKRSEKGNLTAPATTWPADSVFGFIDMSLRSGAAATRLGPTFPELVCDDLGQEAADFIAADDGVASGLPRAVLIAAKGKGGTAGVSASYLYDVCGQVAKNIAYLKVDAQDLPGSYDRWDEPWELNGGEVPRLRAGTTAANFREVFARVRANPSAQRQMWMVLGGGILSKAKLEQEFRSTPPKAHVLQFHHLLLSTYSACQSVGVNLKVFCAP